MVATEATDQRAIIWYIVIVNGQHPLVVICELEPETSV